MAVMGTVAATETAAMATEHTKPVMSVDIAKATTVIDEIAETAASSDGRFLTKPNNKCRFLPGIY
jgi:hypothetical protein